MQLQRQDFETPKTNKRAGLKKFEGERKCASAGGVWQSTTNGLYCRGNGKSYYGKTQQYFKKRTTTQHIRDAWKVIEIRRKKFGEAWYGSGSGSGG